MAELSDENWFWDLALLCDISHKFNDLNINFKVNRSPFLICLWLSELLKWSWHYFRNSWKML